jgi:hypothetical protein
MCDPADAAILVADLPPVFELLHDLDRQADAVENPQHLVIGTGTLAHLNAVGLEADEAWQRQARRAHAERLGRAGAGLRS